MFKLKEKCEELEEDEREKGRSGRTLVSDEICVIVINNSPFMKYEVYICTKTCAGIISLACKKCYPGIWSALCKIQDDKSQ